MAPEADALRVAKFQAALTGAGWADAEDRVAAESIGRMFPGSRRKDALPGGAAGEQLLAARVLYQRAATYAVTTGARGVVFAGCGYPDVPVLHADALARAPRARFVYADPDARITLVNRSQLAGGQVSACQASLRDPRDLMGRPEVAAVSGPLQLQAHFAAHWWAPELARDLVAEYAALLPPGSTLLLSLVIAELAWGGGKFGSAVTEIGGAPVYAHSPEDIAAWITGAGLEFTSRGVAPVRAQGRPWAGVLARPRAPGRAVYVTARKP